MKLHLAGRDADNKTNLLLQSIGVQNRLESYHSLGKKAPSLQFNHLLDSGGFVARTKGIHINVEDYAKYIQEHNVKVAFELDTNDLKETISNREYLLKYTNAKIIPVYHFSDFNGAQIDILDDFIKDFNYISIGGIAGVKEATVNKTKSFFDFVFNKTRDKIKVHGLGITDKKLMNYYPFYSVDSTSWLSFVRFGSSRVASKEMANVLKRDGDHYNRAKIEALHYLKLEKYYTDLWKSRGVNWK